MDNSSLEHFKDVLLRQENEVEHTIELMKENKTAEQDKYSATELSSYDNHPAELGTQLFDLEMNNALRVHEEYLLSEIHEAIQRINKGTFGVCGFCGKEIEKNRLEAVPYSRFCIDCANDKSADKQTLRSKPPYVEQESHQKTFLDEWDDTEFEGLDQWNDLAKYGSSDSPQDMGENRDMEEYYTNEVDLQGIVDHMDNISNAEYKRQLPD